MKLSLLLSLVLISTCVSYAQFTPMPMTMNTPMGPIHTTHYVYMPYQYGQVGAANPKFKFTVQFRDSSKATFKSRILSENKKMYILYKNKQKQRVKIFPADTRTMFAESTLVGFTYGMAVDSCWLFPLGSGAIQSYSSIPFDEYAVIAIQKGKDNTILSLTKEHLREMVSDIEDEKITKWLEKDDLPKVIERYNKLKESKP